jgi:hypothetical protein
MFTSLCEDLPQATVPMTLRCARLSTSLRCHELAFVTVRGSGACFVGRVGVSPAVRGVPASDTSRVENWLSQKKRLSSPEVFGGTPPTAGETPTLPTEH